MLAALVRDKRFGTLGWGVTRAFARNCQVFLGRSPLEAADYLAMQHPLREYDFESHPELRSKFPKQTQEVLRQTAIFQKFLVAQVGDR
jgi:hypothetical protein